jgi:resuscitation-promoting factor RpfA
MKNRLRRWSYPTVLSTAYVLRTCVPHPVQLAAELRSPRAWVADVGTDAAAATLASALLWVIALWVACGLAAVAVSLVPGRLGRLGRAVAERVTPAVLRRIVVTAAGTSILLNPVTAMAAPSTGGSPAPRSTSTVLPALGWPTDPNPVTAPEAVTDPTPATSTVRRSSTGTEPAANGDRVTVRPGDSLWSLAAGRLGATPSAAHIQAEWPRWYAVNRRVIGSDPNLLRPGTTLLVPRPTPTRSTP